MSRADWATGAGLVILGTVAAAALLQVMRLQDRVAGLEDSLRSLRESTARVVREQSPLKDPPADLEAAGRRPATLAAAPAAAGEAPAAGAGPVNVDPPEPARRIPPPPRDSRGTGDADPQDLEAGGIAGRWHWQVFAGFLELDANQTAALEPTYRAFSAEIEEARERLRTTPDYGLAVVRQMDLDLKQRLYDQVLPLATPSQRDRLRSWCGVTEPGTR